VLDGSEEGRWEVLDGSEDGRWEGLDGSEVGCWEVLDGSEVGCWEVLDGSDEVDGLSPVVVALSEKRSSSEFNPSVQDHKCSRSLQTRTSWLHM
jgi:hypothetical protein